MAFFSDFLNWLTGSKPDPEPDAHEVFALRIKAMLEATGLPITFDTEKYALMVNGMQCGLGNHFDEWQMLPEEEREAGLQRYAGLIHGLVTQQPENSPDWEIARPNLRPRIRPKLMLERMLLEHRIENPETDSASYQNLPLSDLLCVQIAYDHPTTISSVTATDLENWGVSEEEALAAAIENMAHTTPDGTFQQVDEGLWACSLGDCYDNARLFLKDRIRALPLEGRPVVLPACRDAVLIAGEHDVTGIGNMLQHCVQLMQQPRFDTSVPLLLDGDQWTRWQPDAAHPRRKEWRELILRAYAGSYGELKELLDRLNEAELNDVFVANASMISNGEDSWTYAVWSPVEAGQLPEVELIAFFRGGDMDGDAFMVPWADVMELAGHMLTRQDETCLPYWAFSDWPTGELLEALEGREYEVPKPA